MGINSSLGNIDYCLENWTNGKYCGYCLWEYRNIKIGFGRVLVENSKFGGSQRQLEVLVHFMASPFLIPSALLVHSSPPLLLGSFG